MNIIIDTITILIIIKLFIKPNKYSVVYTFSGGIGLFIGYLLGLFIAIGIVNYTKIIDNMVLIIYCTAFGFAIIFGIVSLKIEKKLKAIVSIKYYRADHYLAIPTKTITIITALFLLSQTVPFIPAP